MPDRRSLLAGLACAAAVPALAATAANEAAVVAGRKIRLIERERMLVEGIVAHACLALVGMDRAARFARIGDDVARIDAAFAGLVHGDPKMGLMRETSGQVRDALRQASTMWLRFRDRADAVVESGGADRAAVEALAGADEPLLEALGETVTTIERVYADGEVPLHLLIATKLAARQELLAERLAKHACMIAAGIDVERSRALVAEEIAVFDNRLAALANGFPMLGIRAPANPVLVAQWQAVAESWGALRPGIEAIATGAAPTPQATAALVDRMDPFVALLDEAVVLYERER
ncbi:MAG: type IV pili methyl-accepting chemotaxis transducer N-terminal domain-containing protein [Paracoccaceae bacterium]